MSYSKRPRRSRSQKMRGQRRRFSARLDLLEKLLAGTQTWDYGPQASYTSYARTQLTRTATGWEMKVYDEQVPSAKEEKTREREG